MAFVSNSSPSEDYTGILNDPVPQDYTRDIPDI